MISKLAHVDPSARIADNVTIHPFAYIDADVEIGEGCEILPYVTINSGTRMGKNNKIYQGAVIGADPQDFRWKGEKTYCYIGDNNIIREQVIINRGIHTDGGTHIGNGCFILAETHIGHDTHIVGPAVLGNGVKIAGDTFVDHHAILSSNVILNERAKVGEWAFIKAGCRISSSVPPFVIMAHNPVAYYGVNTAIMTRDNRFNDEDIDVAAKAYRHLYQTPTSTFNALRRIEADIEPGPVRDSILDFVKTNNMKIAGKIDID